MRRAVLVAGLLALLAGVAVWWIPYLVRDRDYATSVVQPLPMTAPALVVLGPSQRACMQPATMSADSGQGRFSVGTYYKPGPPLELTIDGPGYAARRAIPAGFADNTTLQVGVPAPRRDVSVRICIANRGTRRVALHASADRTKTAALTRVDGRAVRSNPTFAFYTARRVSIAAKLSRIVDRISLFKPSVVAPWLLWPLLLAFVAGIPVGTLWALHRALVQDGDRDPANGTDDAGAATPEYPVRTPAA